MTKRDYVYGDKVLRPYSNRKSIYTYLSNHPTRNGLCFVYSPNSGAMAIVKTDIQLAPSIIKEIEEEKLL